ncbi:universal stress protein UspE [Alteromonas lipolytica]|uniref:Universal stress protein UspE n=1 Tax=Alteromonas lipolytica TaxID=1856405 RepID=A0A1E8FGZ6_9ALTE|nr:universal stress protein UspE [Alteromonas lipolytica]OFI35227.1 universal stress protein UspE [Alteromonas lipolytica]GGF57756.1 universal stress protein E [Alteromonas lipolytica]
MIEYSQILAVVEPEKDTQPALSRALELADKTGAQITALMTIYDFSYEMTTMLSGEEREAMREAVVKERTTWLQEQLAQYSQPIQALVAWNNRPYEAIIKTAIELSADIVVKATRSHDDLRSVIFTPTDWHLVRKCPAPVLLVKEHDWPQDGKIIAAVNVGTEDREHAQLNNTLTTIAQDYAKLLSGHVHLANCYPGTPLNIAIEVPEFDPETYNQSVKNHHLEEMEKHSARFSIPLDNCHVREGLPEKAIPQIARELDAELVIIGTVGRVGISAALIGNTAEHVIDELNCDVLAIKPDGFISPVS